MHETQPWPLKHIQSCNLWCKLHLCVDDHNSWVYVYSNFQDKTFLVVHPEEIRNSKRKSAHISNKGQQASCGVIVMVMAWSVMGTDGFRCEEDLSGQLAAAVPCPFESTVAERWQMRPLRTVLLPSLFPSTPGCTYRDKKKCTLGHFTNWDTKLKKITLILNNIFNHYLAVFHQFQMYIFLYFNVSSHNDK